MSTATALHYPSERSLVDEIEAAFVSHGWAVRREVYVYADLTDRQKRRVDLLARPPVGHWLLRHFPCGLALEAKNYASLEEVRVAKRQAISAMTGFDFQWGPGAFSRKGTPTVRPSIALIATEASWRTGRALFTSDHGDTSALAVIERDLWEHGCGVLMGPPDDPYFQSNSGGVPGGKKFRIFGGAA